MPPHCDAIDGPVARAALFIETVVRLHRMAEGASFTGLKPTGLDRGPVIPLAEAAIATGSLGRLDRRPPP